MQRLVICAARRQTLAKRMVELERVGCDGYGTSPVHTQASETTGPSHYSHYSAILVGMHCPFCQNPDTKVVDTRLNEDGHSIRRRRECPKCGKRFTTVETSMLLVMKRSGNIEPFDREKVVSGVRKACQGRPINEDDLKLLGQKVEEDLRSRGLAQVKSDEVGRAILGPLRDLDEVAYLRFASVYQNFEGLDDFESAISELKHNKNAA
jgi:transcriptional repressor NrdR